MFVLSAIDSKSKRNKMFMVSLSIDCDKKYRIVYNTKRSVSLKEMFGFQKLGTTYLSVTVINDEY